MPKLMHVNRPKWRTVGEILEFCEQTIEVRPRLLLPCIPKKFHGSFFSLGSAVYARTSRRSQVGEIQLAHDINLMTYQEPHVQEHSVRFKSKAYKL